MLEFKWAKTDSNAVAPSKGRELDTGFDLTLIKESKVRGKVHYFDTGIMVAPPEGYYFDLVGRSSISKSGWMLANNVGIIDHLYRGSILAAMIKIDPDAKPLTLPCKLVQIIPRRLELMDMKEINMSDMDKTTRGSGGFGSTDKKKSGLRIPLGMWRHGK